MPPSAASLKLDIATPTPLAVTLPSTLTEQNKADLTRCAEEILLAREHYFPATIADMYDRDRMDTEFPLVHAAHETPSKSLRDLPGAMLRDRNDEVLERIYIGRRFKNDTVGASEAMPDRAIAFPQGKRLEKLFELYTKMTAK